MTRRRLVAAASVATLGLGWVLCGPQVRAQSEQGNEQPGQRRGDRRVRRGPASPDQELQHLTRALDLTDDQQKQIRPILEDRQKEMKALMSDSSMSREDKMSKGRGIREDSDKKIREALNDDQKQRFDEMQKRRGERMQERRSGEENKRSENE